jgi:RNA polymerase sigma-70 factor (ECF subfamily)
MSEFDDELHQCETSTPETLASQADQRRYVVIMLESLPARYREVLVLRELDGCSYKEIAQITGIPMGAVMSTLSRARERLQRTVMSAVS